MMLTPDELGTGVEVMQPQQQKLTNKGVHL